MIKIKKEKTLLNTPVKLSRKDITYHQRELQQVLCILQMVPGLR